MTSEVQKLASNVRLMGSKTGPIRPAVAQASLWATKRSSSVPGGVPSANALATALESAGRELAKASSALDEFARQAGQFADRLASGSGGRASDGTSGQVRAPRSFTALQGGSRFQTKTDPTTRAVCFIQDIMYCGRLGKAAARNISAGRDALAGIDLDHGSHLELITQDYPMAALEADVRNAGEVIANSTPTKITGTLYKGLHMQPGARVNLDSLSLWSTTNQPEVALAYANHKADSDTAVLVEIRDAEGIEFPENREFHHEALITGRLEIIGDSFEHGIRKIVTTWKGTQK